MEAKKHKHEAHGRQYGERKYNIEDEANDSLLHLNAGEGEGNLSQGENEHEG